MGRCADGVIGIAAGAAGGYALARMAGGLFENVQLPGALPVIGAAIVLIAAAIAASLVPAARASRRCLTGRFDRVGLTAADELAILSLGPTEDIHTWV